MGVPSLRFVKYQKIFEELDIREELQAGVLVRVLGDLKGIFLFLMDEPFADAILGETVAELREETERNLADLDELEQSVLKELGNIMCGSYIRAMSQVTEMEMDVSVPDLCIDMGGAILDVPLACYLEVSDVVLLIENMFYMGEQSYKGRILFWPEMASMADMLKKLRE